MSNLTQEIKTNVHAPMTYPYWAWLVCLSAGLFFLYEFFQLTVFDVINAPLREALHLDATQFSALSSSYLWANVLFLLPAGYCLDRYSVRWVILMAMSVCVIGTIGFACASSFVAVFFFHALAGIGNAFCFLSCIVLVSHWFLPSRQALVIGLIVTMAFLGGMLAHTPFAYLSAMYGWREALWVDAGLGFMIWVWLFLILRDNPAVEPLSIESLSKSTVVSCFMVVLKNPQNILAGLFTACLNLPIMVLCALWGADYLSEVHHLTAIQASNVVSMILLGSIFGCPLAGYCSDKMGRRKPLMLFGAGMTLFLGLVLMMANQHSPIILSTLFFLLGFVSSAQVIGYPVITESNSPQHTGLATGMASILIMGGAGLGQILFGVLMHHHAGDTLHYLAADYRFALILFPMTAFWAIVAVFFLKETFCRQI